jgi:inner membrane protein
MPTVFTHAAVGFVAAKFAGEATTPNTRIALACMALSALPDADALFIGMVPYNHPFGHRGFTHSLFFAVVIGAIAAFSISRFGWAGDRSIWALALLFFAVIALHGFFDAMTDGGLGVAFFAPFSNSRYFLPWRPIPVAPLSFEGLLTQRGMRVIRYELALFWFFALAAFVWDRQTTWRMILSGASGVIGVTVWAFALKGG